jgi:hypothetical protein
LLLEAGYAFRFRSNDGGEPPHVHISGNGGSAKIWLAPAVKMAAARGYSWQRRGEIIRISEAHRDEWIATWQRHFRNG